MRYSIKREVFPGKPHVNLFPLSQGVITRNAVLRLATLLIIYSAALVNEQNHDRLFVFSICLQLKRIQIEY